MKIGKLTANEKQLDSHDIPTDRFYKRMIVYIFREIDKRKIPVKYANFFCSCHDEFYYCGDCEDDEIPYYIPKEWVTIKTKNNETK